MKLFCVNTTYFLSTKEKGFMWFLRQRYTDLNAFILQPVISKYNAVSLK